MCVIVKHRRMRDVSTFMVHMLPDLNIGKRHDWHELIYVAHGCYEAVVNGNRIIAHPGDVVFYPRQTEHIVSVPMDGSVQVYIVQWYLSEHEYQPAAPCTVRDIRGRIFGAIMWMNDAGLIKDEAHKDLCEMLLQMMLTEIIDLHTTTTSLNLSDPISRARNWMLTHISYSGGMLVHILAAEAGMTPSQFSRTFKEATGETPRHFMQRLRVEAALPLILQADMTIAQIATRVGFYDSSHLYRLVLRYCGQSPQDMREQSRHAGSTNIPSAMK